MRSFVTSYNGLFTRSLPNGPTVERIEIPLIQRDYAQGREGDDVARIRANFLAVLHEALTGGEPVILDFVYGDVTNGTLHPLDGQQRLTTLFLLHWYLAWRADRLQQEQGWKHFSYATRASARLFCERLAACTPPDDAEVRAWLEDQPWFLHTWENDPTIQSMLVMLEAIHTRFAGSDYAAAWTRLVAPDKPAIAFHLLPVEQMGLSDDLYIKMNSRGKPLTPFENFKARFEQVLEGSCPEHVEAFAQKVDGDWADLLWHYRGSDQLVDDEFLRYFQFVTEVCEWQDGRLPSGDVASLAETVYGPESQSPRRHLEFLFRCFDTWMGAPISAAFTAVFADAPAPLDTNDTTKVVLFGDTTLDLFGACCESYALPRGRNRVFSLQQTLLLYAVLLHRLQATPNFARRLRVLRNLIEASGNELRLEKMPAHIADVRRLIVEGAVAGMSSFNQAQVADEQLKAALIAEHPALEHHVFRLEDHEVLRGCLSAFELDATVFERRARAFHEVFAEPLLFPVLTGALLAAGDYSRRLSHRSLQLGSRANLKPWRDLLTGASRVHLASTREVLGRLLDLVAARQGDVRSTLDTIAAQWLADSRAAIGFDWRWYFVKYPVMREGRSGIYACVGGNLGYRVCMLEKESMNSYYRDPYLAAMVLESGVAEGAVKGAVAHHWTGGPWFAGYETEPRWMRLTASGVELQCVEDGLLLRAPVAEHADAFVRVCEAHGVGADLRLTIPQVEVDGRRLDTQDRVQLGAALVRDLVGAGL